MDGARRIAGGGARFGLALAAPTAADLPGLAELLAGHGLVASDLAARLDALRSHGAVLLAHEWGPPSGVVAAHWHAALVGPTRRAAIDLLLVAPDARRRGIGRLLIKGIAQAARQAGCETLRLVLPDDAEGSLAPFAGASGFVPHGGTWERPLRRAVG